MRVFIATSGKEGVLSIYKDLASSVATVLSRHGYKLVYGGGDTGMMGTLYMTYKYEGNKVKGFYDISEANVAQRLELDAVDIAPNTFIRSNHLYEHADLIVILPGGFGTLAELFSMIVEKQTKKDNKHIVLFNYNKYYDNLLYNIKDMMDERFINEESLQQFDIITTISDFEEYINKLNKEEE